MGTKQNIKRTLNRTISLEMHDLPQFYGCGAGCGAGNSKDIAASVYELPRCAVRRLHLEKSIPDMTVPFAVIARRVPCSPQLSSLLSGAEFPDIFWGIFITDELNIAVLRRFLGEEVAQRGAEN